MNSIGFGRNSNILIHAAPPTNVDGGEKSVPQKSLETSKAKSLLAALRPSNWRGNRQVNMTGTDETRMAQNQNESLPLAGGENMVGFQQLHAIPVSSISNDRLLTFDILRYTVFATTEMIDPSLLLGGEIQSASSFSSLLDTMYTFNPTIVSADAAKTIIDPHLTEQITTTIETAIQTANDKFSAKKSASGSAVKIVQVRSKEEIIADLPDEEAHPQSTNTRIQIEPTQHQSEKLGSNISASVEGDQSLRNIKIKVSEWVRKEENITHPLIRVAQGPTAPLHAFARTLNHNKNVSKTVGNSSDVCHSDVPYTLHFYSGGVGGKSAPEAKSKLPAVVLPPASSDLHSVATAPSDDQIHAEVPLPTINDLSAFRPVHARSLVIRLFQDYIPTSQDNGNSSASSPKGGTSPHHHHQGHAANEYDNDDGFGPSSNSQQQLQKILNNNSICDGGTQLFLRNWETVEAVMSRAIVGEQQLRSSSNGSGGGTVSKQKPVPGWVPEIISAVKKDIKQKMEDRLRRAQQLNGGNTAAMTPPLFRLKYLCFVPFVICHPATTRRINFMFRPKALSVGGNTDEDKAFQPSSETAQSTEEKRGEAQSDQKTTATLVAKNKMNSVDQIGLRQKESLPFEATEPKAFMLALNVENSALGIASLDGVISDSNYIVSILPKYGS